MLEKAFLKAIQPSEIVFNFASSKDKIVLLYAATEEPPEGWRRENS
jgi:hypothetical protein